MQCPRCKSLLAARESAYGVVVDFCRNCQGLWLDRGEVKQFAAERASLRSYLKNGLIEPRQTTLACPACCGPMRQGLLLPSKFEPRVEVDECASCGGIWFDANELRHFRDASQNYKDDGIESIPDPPSVSVSAPLRSATGGNTISGTSSTGLTYELRPGAFPSVTLNLNRNHKVYTESGGMSWMRGDIVMDTGVKGGIFKGLGRMLAGESFFLTTYSGDGDVTFNSEFPGSIISRDMSGNRRLVIQKDAFLVAETTVTLSLYLQKRLMTGLFGGEGFILQQAAGSGLVFLEVCGDLIETELQMGERIQVDPGHVAAFEESVAFELRWLKGIRNALFSGEGLFIGELRGPGKVWLQSMTMPGLASKIKSYLPAHSVGRGKADRSLGSNVIDAFFGR